MIARLFRETADIEKFRESVMELKGSFPFDRDDMIEIGHAYFERYPDCFSNRNCQEVTLGYKLVRICIVEKLIDHGESVLADACRAMFNDISGIQERCAELVAAVGFERVAREHDEIGKKLQDIQNSIDRLPTGMIKERFVGGVANIYNIIYLIKNNLDKLKCSG